jgi:hypothetical protein
VRVLGRAGWRKSGNKTEGDEENQEEKGKAQREFLILNS